MDLMLRNEASRAPWVSSVIACHVCEPLHSKVNVCQRTKLTRRRGDTSTDWRRTVPARPMRVESSRGPALLMALTST